MSEPIRAALRPVGHRVERGCDVCGQFDSDPRHALTETVDGAAVDRLRHFDCCAAQGCDVCAASEGKTGGARGDALVKTLQKGVKF